MKALKIDPAIRSDADYEALVETANRYLELELGPSAETVAVEWTLIQDPRDRPLLRLILNDWSDTSSIEFAPEELRRTRHTESRINSLWGKHLMKQSHRLLLNTKRTSEVFESSRWQIPTAS